MVAPKGFGGCLRLGLNSSDGFTGVKTDRAELAKAPKLTASRLLTSGIKPPTALSIGSGNRYSFLPSHAFYKLYYGATQSLAFNPCKCTEQCETIGRGLDAGISNSAPSTFAHGAASKK
jgi:hypothetical protein